MPTDKLELLSKELFELMRKHQPNNMEALGVLFSLACVCCDSMGLSKLEAQKLFVKLWDEGAKDPDIAAFKKENARQ